MKANMKKSLSVLLAILMLASMNITVFAEEGDFTGNSLTGTSDFYYTVTSQDVYTDISAVKLAWSVPVVKYTTTHTLTWNTTDLKWEETNPTGTSDNAVTFILANYGSYAVKASVSFALDSSNEAGAATVSYVKDDVNTNNPTLNCIVNGDHSLKVEQGTMGGEEYLAAKKAYIDDTEHGCKATISGTVTLTPEKLSANSGKLGTYTVSISQPAS